MIKKIKNLISFLTIFPVGMTDDCLVDASNLMYLFPVVGALIGFIAGLFAFALTYILPTMMVGVMVCGLILLLTRLHHMDGLLDFGDGLMCQGPPEKKIEVMHDKQTGTGGFMLGVVTFLVTALCISHFKPYMVLQSLIASETFAKFSMVILAWSGTSAHEGMNTYFINAMHGHHRNLRLGASLAISLAIAFLTLRIVGLIALVASIIAALVILLISNNHFGGVTGDVMGASNELTRMASLLSILALASTSYV
ncbi:MAG: adenosylcobinamide-GDP ribazoletransferase [Candidatus Bathyarchaeota archaeon]|nr:adenosylcobinamide-GDP ribazoletransferase [Candidatus Bathyarchaeota archaeon]MDW8040615.1 adenosylcobinamide-GDP ribazoletransferase [Nitrososphaerota archaeon]